VNSEQSSGIGVCAPVLFLFGRELRLIDAPVVVFSRFGAGRYFGVDERVGFLDRQPCEDEASCCGVNLAVGTGWGWAGAEGSVSCFGSERYFGVEESLGFLDRQPCEDHASCYGVNLAVGTGCGPGSWDLARGTWLVGTGSWERAVELAPGNWPLEPGP
jgi:hypothetical protein